MDGPLQMNYTENTFHILLKNIQYNLILIIYSVYLCILKQNERLRNTDSNLGTNNNHFRIFNAEIIN